jgi:hypothetical protein
MQYQYGWGCIAGGPVLAETIAPKAPEQQRIANLQAAKDRAADALSAERQRQQDHKITCALQTFERKST